MDVEAVDMTRAWIAAGIVLVALAAGALHQYRGRIAAEAMAEYRQEQADSLAEVARKAVAVAQRADFTARAEIERATVQRTEAEERARTLAARRPEIVERVVMAASPADTAAVRAVVVELEAAHAEEVAAYRTALAAADSIIAAQVRQLAAKDRAMVGLEAALAASQAEADAWEDARPGWLERGGKAVAWAAVGYGVGRLLGG